MAFRREREFDRTIFENLCAMAATPMEMAYVLETIPDTLHRWVNRTYGATLYEVQEKIHQRVRKRLGLN